MDATLVLNGFMGSSPYLAGWIIAVVLGAIMVRRGGSKAERLFIAGAILMLVSAVLRALGIIILPFLLQRGATPTEAAMVISNFNFGRGFIELAGIICLVFAFWVKFRVRPSESPAS